MIEVTEECRLHDVKLQGRSYTLYRSNERCKSQIERALVNEKLLGIWRSATLRGLPRLISDHCPRILDTKELDWGPRPFRFVNARTSHLEFLEVLESSWKEEGIVGWGCYVFKEN